MPHMYVPVNTEKTVVESILPFFAVYAFGNYMICFEQEYVVHIAGAKD